MRYGLPMAQPTRQVQASSADHSVRHPLVTSQTETKAELDRAKPVVAVTWQSNAIPIGLFLFAATLLLFKLGKHPDYAYNWESYTTWRFFAWWDNPSTSIFELNDGLMTDSGSSPFVAPLIWIGFKLLGVGLLALRLPGALAVATVLPLTWVVGRRLVGERAALLGAFLLGLLPAFLLYGRTATNVAISLVPALITIYVLIRALKEPRRLQWLALLQLMFVLNSYSYSPIRFLWPISIALFATEVLFQPKVRRRLALGLLVTVATLPLVLAFIDPATEFNPASAVGDYFHARGEQVFAWDGDPELYKFYLEPTREEVIMGRLLGSEQDLAWRLVKRNATSFTNLLLDRDTTPAIIDFWNPHGRLYFVFLVPFFLLGVAKSLWKLFRRTEDRVLQACMWGFSLPLLLTSQVHIGRLIYILPLVCLFTASGLFWLVDVVVARWRHPRIRRLPSIAMAATALLLLVATARASWSDYRDAPPPVRDERIIAQLKAGAGEIAASNGNAVLVRAGDNHEVEAINVSTYRLQLDDTYQFVDIGAGQTVEVDDGKPALLYGLVLRLLDNPDAVPSFCENTYYVDSEVLSQFSTKTSDAMTRCGHPVRYVELAK
jgi:4-amino-4-deoxy-L-arabinose transferase-like glycosyltransferase